MSVQVAAAQQGIDGYDLGRSAQDPLRSVQDILFEADGASASVLWKGEVLLTPHLQSFSDPVMIRSMSSDDDPSSFRNGHWQIQPLWVKVLTISVTVPAFLVLVAGVGGTIESAALVAFIATVILQTGFVLGAYSRMDL